jgi:CDP-paratose 2-epimerase
MGVILVTGSAGLIGSEAVRFFCRKGYTVVGVDNDMRASFFGEEASTDWNLQQLEAECPTYLHWPLDIRDSESISKIFREYGTDIKLIIHAAAQPSHDWAARDPFTDFTVNANGTLAMLENTRRFTPNAVFIFTSTNKVYGDTPNSLPLIELETRWELELSHRYYDGIDESMSIDQTMHSLFGASKIAADVLVQEYGKYFGMKTACFRGGCLTGPSHSGTQLHGFLSYLMKCALTGNPYTIFGYKGKQVRDNIHSFDFVNAIFHYFKAPRVGEIYNIGGGRHSNCSIQEAVMMCEEIVGKPMKIAYTDKHRNGDHIWWISSIEKFRKHYPEWHISYNVWDILTDIFRENKDRWRS